jgi:hypothetical protein
MTRELYADYGTEFSKWLRSNKEIDSKDGFIATNLDYIWANYKTGYWMLIEEKRHMSELRYSQRKQFEKITSSIVDDKFLGFHFIQFENTGPEDGMVFLDGKEITKEELVSFLKFEKRSDYVLAV